MQTDNSNPLWNHNAGLLGQAIEMVVRLQNEAQPGFHYPQAIGPHLRHIIEHYTALLAALDSPSGLVDYDGRERDMTLQSVPQATVSKLNELRARMHFLASVHSPATALDTPLTTCLKAGPVGEISVTSSTSLGRELSFLSSHTVHHFAVMAQYCKSAGVDLGHDFGKAPATLAYERQSA